MPLEVRPHTQKGTVKWILNNKWKGNSFITIHIATIYQSLNVDCLKDQQWLMITFYAEEEFAIRLPVLPVLILRLVNIPVCIITKLYCTQWNTKVTSATFSREYQSSSLRGGIRSICTYFSNMYLQNWPTLHFFSCHWNCTCSASNTQ